MNTPPIHAGGSPGISTGSATPMERQESKAKVTQPSADKSPVRIEEVTRSQGRTLDELHPRGNTGRPLPPLRHHEEERSITVDDVRKPFEAAARKIEADAFETIDAFTHEFVGGLREAEKDLQKIHGSLEKLDGSLDKLDGSLEKLGQTIERGFGGIRNQLREYSNWLDEFGERFQSGQAEDRIVRQRIVDTMKKSNRDLKEINALQKETIQIVQQSNESTNNKLAEMRTKRDRRNPPPPPSEAGSSTVPSTMERLQAMRAKREAHKTQRKDEKKQ